MTTSRALLKESTQRVVNDPPVLEARLRRGLTYALPQLW